MAGGARPARRRTPRCCTSSKLLSDPGVSPLPLAFQNAGLELGLVTLLTLAVGVTLNLRTLVLCKRYYNTNGAPPTPGGRVHKTTTYADVAERALGKYGRMLVEVLVHIVQLGVCAVYFDFFGENMRACCRGRRGSTSVFDCWLSVSSRSTARWLYSKVSKDR